MIFKVTKDDTDSIYKETKNKYFYVPEPQPPTHWEHLLTIIYKYRHTSNYDEYYIV